MVNKCPMSDSWDRRVVLGMDAGEPSTTRRSQGEEKTSDIGHQTSDI
jgi:hypothetical protein